MYRSADIALVAGGNRKRWIIATENMHVGDIIKTSGAIGRMAGVTFASRSAVKCQRFSGCQIILVWYLEINTTYLLSLCHFAVLANEGDAYPLGALPVGTLVNNLEIQPGKGAEYIRAAGKIKFCLGLYTMLTTSLYFGVTELQLMNCVLCKLFFPIKLSLWNVITMFCYNNSWTYSIRLI